VHAYWDQFWALAGLRAAPQLANVVGDMERYDAYTALRDDFQTDLLASVPKAMAMHAIDYVPGSVELGDYDPSSTAVAVNLLGDDPAMRPALERTFHRYLDEIATRRDGSKDWTAYSPYELRNVEALVELGWRDDAHGLLDWIVADRRPPGWNEWAEISYHDPTAPQFIGDMPHTWVGCIFVHALRTMLVHERESDHSLVVGAGVPSSWIARGVTARRMPTANGILSFTMKADGDDAVRVRLSGDVAVPRGGLVVTSPYDRPIRRVTRRRPAPSRRSPRRQAVTVETRCLRGRRADTIEPVQNLSGARRPPANGLAIASPRARLPASEDATVSLRWWRPSETARLIGAASETSDGRRISRRALALRRAPGARDGRRLRCRVLRQTGVLHGVRPRRTGASSGRTVRDRTVGVGAAVVRRRRIPEVPPRRGSRTAFAANSMPDYAFEADCALLALRNPRRRPARYQPARHADDQRVVDGCSRARATSGIVIQRPARSMTDAHLGAAEAVAPCRAQRTPHALDGGRDRPDSRASRVTGGSSMRGCWSTRRAEHAGPSGASHHLGASMRLSNCIGRHDRTRAKRGPPAVACL
jgi:hypothetical protein